MGSDSRLRNPLFPSRSISIHAPRVGSDQAGGLSYLLLRNFNPRSPCGERPDCAALDADNAAISIHAPRVGSDCWIQGNRPRFPRFQSTLPVWGATARSAATASQSEISIHAPRVGSDGAITFGWTTPKDFNPRSPCGERHDYFTSCLPSPQFQSTLPVWGATVLLFCSQ